MASIATLIVRKWEPRIEEINYSSTTASKEQIDRFQRLIMRASQGQATPTPGMTKNLLVSHESVA